MRPIGFGACLALVCGASAAPGQDAERFDRFHDRGVFDEGVSNESANALVAEGIASEDPVIVETTIHALAGYTVYLPHSAPPGVIRGAGAGPFGPLPTRTFHEVDGLKAFLMTYWRQTHASSGYNLDASQRAAFERVSGLELAPEPVPRVVPRETPPEARSSDSPRPDPSQGIRDALVEIARGLDFENPRQASGEEILIAYGRQFPAWHTIPGTLCALWPRDPEVLEFVWEIQSADRSPRVWLTTLGLLNIGLFATAEADAFRLKELARSRAGPDGHVAALFAARGLALARRPEALAALIAAGVAHRSAIRDIAIAVAGYSDEQLSAHAAELRDLLPLPRVPGGARDETQPPALQARMDAESRAFERLNAVTDNAGP